MATDERYWLSGPIAVIEAYQRIYRHRVLDRIRQPQDIVAVVDDPVDGERLVRLLNADEKRRKEAGT